MLCCCGVELAGLVVGLLTIDRGVFQLGQWRVVRGTPAYVIGGILAAMFPLLLIGGGILRVIEAMTGNPPGPVLEKVILSPALAAVVIGLPVVIVIVLAAGEYPNRPTSTTAPSESRADVPIAQMEANNPYTSPSNVPGSESDATP